MKAEGEKREKVKRVRYVSIKSTRGEQSRVLCYVRAVTKIFQNNSGSVEDEKIHT